MKVAVFHTPRLLMRCWRDEDKPLFAAMNRDPQVMEFFPALRTVQESEAAVDRFHSEILQRGWGSWAVERVDTHEFIGFVGLSVPRSELPCSPCVEVGWRLLRAHWGHGFASEAAKQALQYGFENLALESIVSFTALQNRRSRAVMERIGMQDTHQNFEHPAIPEGHRLRRHCLYRISRQQWQTQQLAIHEKTPCT